MLQHAIGQQQDADDVVFENEDMGDRGTIALENDVTSVEL